jgi:hypothetical protein
MLLIFMQFSFAVLGIEVCLFWCMLLAALAVGFEFLHVKVFLLP